MTVTCDTITNFKSTLELTTNAHNCDTCCNSDNNNHQQYQHSSNSNENSSKKSKVLRIVWHNLYEKYEHFCKQTKLFKNLVYRESNKPLAKKFRHSLRLNKSAKKKGYKYFISDEDKR